MTPWTSPSELAFSTRASTEARDDTSTVVVVTSKPASLNVFAAASAFSWRRSASSSCLPAPTRRAMAWPIEPGPITTITFVMLFLLFLFEMPLAAADADAAADVEARCRHDPGNQRGQAVERDVVPPEGLTLLCNLGRAFRLARKPARPEDRVVEIGRLDQRRRIPVRIEDAAVLFARHFAIDAH